MKVYLVPAGPSRFALYSEVLRPVHDGTPDSPTLWGRIVAAFRRAVDEGEAEAAGTRLQEHGARSPGKLRRFITRKLAEAVAEQRLLWSLRHERSATLVHPDRVPPAQAVETARAEFALDFGRHRRWAVIDSLLVVITGPVFFFVPGPNVISWYFTFRAVGHYFSMKGAHAAMHEGFFSPEASRPLTAVADALTAPPEVRDLQISAAADELGLEKLSAFINRVADRPV